MGIRDVLRKEMKKSGGTARVVNTPQEKRLTTESNEKLNRKINAQIEANENMRNRSWKKVDDER